MSPLFLDDPSKYSSSEYICSASLAAISFLRLSLYSSKVGIGSVGSSVNLRQLNIILIQGASAFSFTKFSNVNKFKNKKN
jgi:hypothetical protein